MSTTARRTPADRDRAVARLRSITIGTGVAGVIAVGAFGALAAQTYDGTTTGVTTAAVTTAETETIGETTTTTTTTTTTATSAAPATTTPTAAPTATTGTAHAATGSS